MKNFIFLLLVISFFINCNVNDPEVIFEKKKDVSKDLFPRSEAPCFYQSNNCSGLSIRWKNLYSTANTITNCCPLQSPAFVLIKNTYYYFNGVSCEQANFESQIIQSPGSWTDLPCQAKFSNCGYCQKIEFLVRWGSGITYTFNYGLEFEINGPCGPQTFYVCNNNGPQSCAYAPYISGSQYIYDSSVFYYKIDNSCCIDDDTDCASTTTNCAISNDDDCGGPG